MLDVQCGEGLEVRQPLSRVTKDGLSFLYRACLHKHVPVRELANSMNLNRFHLLHSALREGGLDLELQFSRVVRTYGALAVDLLHGNDDF